jgi:hypothetical protein
MRFVLMHVRIASNATSDADSNPLGVGTGALTSRVSGR